MRKAILFLLFLLASLAVTAGLWAQGASVDRLSIGPVAVHDHIRFDFHIPARGDPYPHEFKQGYAFDGVDILATIGWHWGGAHLLTQVRVTPASRTHFAYDQDTDTRPGNNFTHGNAGQARSRSFGFDQSLPLAQSRRWGAFDYHAGLLRQWTRYHQVTTYDLNTNPALVSNTYTRLISERAIVYELRSSVGWSKAERVGNWQSNADLDLTPLSAIFLRNYIPVVLAATSTQAYGAALSLAASHPIGSWRVQVIGSAGEFHGYHAEEAFRRETYGLGVQFSPPRFW